ncbi:MAG: ATP-binding protein [bacterium]
MKLRSALQIGAIFPIFLVILICLTLGFGRNNMSAISDTIQQTAGLTAAVSELDFSSHQWVMNGNQATEAEWRKNNENISSILANIKSADNFVQVRVKSMLDACRSANTTFTALVSTRAKQTDTGQQAFSPKQRELLHNLLAKNRELIADCSLVTSTTQSGVVSIQQDMDLMIAIWFAILALMMAGGMLFAGRRIMQRFEVVSNRISAIADVKLDHKLTMPEHDEFDQFLHSFNRISQQLGQSKEVLQKEALEHQSAAEALRKTNVILSDALIKLKRAQTQAVDSSRLGALSQMVHGMEHSFNNTLTPILGLSDFLLSYPESLNDHKALTEHLRTINSAVNKAKDQIEHMAEFFQPVRDLHTIPININDLLQQTVRATRRIWQDAPKEKGIMIQLTIEPGDIPLVEADHAGLCEAVTNIIVNSAEAMSHAGTITISTRREAEQVILRITDNGDGMIGEVRDRCLEPFFSTKGSGSAGMGLTVVAGTVKHHGGTLNIESTPGTGTTVTISLPIHARTMADGQDSKHSPAGNRYRVLVADDEPWVLHLCSTALQAEGHDVKIAADGSAALSLFRSGHFEIVILDQAMPLMTGDELATIIRHESPTTRIIMLTGFVDVMLKENARSEFVDIILSKPVSIDALNNAVVTLMAGNKQGESSG